MSQEKKEEKAKHPSPAIVETAQGKNKVYVETHNKELDMPTLDKLLKSKPPVGFKESLRTIYVRCDRNTGKWVECDEQGKPTSKMDVAIMVDVELSSVYKAYGCGGEYTGFARGKKLSSDQPVSVPKEHVRKLVFDRHEGEFSDSKTGETVVKADYLILKEGCHHDFIAGPPA